MCLLWKRTLRGGDKHIKNSQNTHAGHAKFSRGCDLNVLFVTHDFHSLPEFRLRTLLTFFVILSFDCKTRLIVFFSIIPFNLRDFHCPTQCHCNQFPSVSTPICCTLNQSPSAPALSRRWRRKLHWKGRVPCRRGHWEETLFDTECRDILRNEVTTGEEDTLRNEITRCHTMKENYYIWMCH